MRIESRVFSTSHGWCVAPAARTHPHCYVGLLSSGQHTSMATTGGPAVVRGLVGAGREWFSSLIIRKGQSYLFSSQKDTEKEVALYEIVSISNNE
jgi:hypothetical protein